MNVISTFFKEEGDFLAKAEVTLDKDCYSILYYDQNSNHFHTESFPGKSLHYVEDAAENWALGIKVLNG